MNSAEKLHLKKFTYQQLFDVTGLQALDNDFLQELMQIDPTLKHKLLQYRDSSALFTPLEISDLLLAIAPLVQGYIAQLFNIETALQNSGDETRGEDVVLQFKKEFVLRRARRYRGEVTRSFADLTQQLLNELKKHSIDQLDPELSAARYAKMLLLDADNQVEQIEMLTQWCVSGLKTAEGQHFVKGWVSFKLPQRVDHLALVPLHKVDGDRLQRLTSAAVDMRPRDSFSLTDLRANAREVQSEVQYCIYCHDHDGDFCSKGFPEKKGRPELGFKQDPHGVTLTGCPLEEKISEMHALKRDGHNIAALVVAMIDNPMIPATGHRICNDCMKACVYQKQDPVNIPQIETRVLTDVLALPWGVEIYDLLTRWNPLRQTQYVMQANNGRKVLVVGMGPAGFTMAHHLTMEGCAVVGIDGLKIEPLPEVLLNQPVRDWSSMEENLDERIVLGFGGVAEYGITVRWDKNFLKLIYLTLARRANFQVFGGVRFGGTLTLDNAWDLGFDHVCVATGAGLPRVLNIPNSMARGMRQASDFLMALQLTGAGKDSSLANLQVRLPAVVIGGGLTAVDTATEVQAYYIKQVEKTLVRHEAMLAQFGEAKIVAGMNEEDRAILDEFLRHGLAVRKERESALQESRAPDFIKLIRNWGGVTLVYRKGMSTSPAYTRNHEELIKAMEEGLYYAEGLDPLKVEVDAYSHVSAMIFRQLQLVEGNWLTTEREIALPARAIFVAAGAVPNTIYEQEHAGSFKLDGNHFLPHIEHEHNLQSVQVADHIKSEEFGAFTSYEKNGRGVSFLGDTHPVFHGSVVRAIASSKRSYPHILRRLNTLNEVNASDKDYSLFRTHMTDMLSARVEKVRRDNPAMTEIWIKAPMAARNFRPGQFFRLQTFESFSPIVDETRLQVPVLTVSGTGVKEDAIRLLVLQWGSAPRLVGRLQPGDPVVLMGPTGAPTQIGNNQTVMVIAGRWGAAVMLDIGSALRAAGNKVIYVAAFSKASEVDNRDELEAGADQIIWCTASEPRIDARRPQDLSIVATDMVDVIRRYGNGELYGDRQHIALQNVNRVMVMGSTGLLRGFQTELRRSLKEYFPEDVQALGTVGSPMQCMLKGVCAQCLQWQIDPETGQRTRCVFSCAGQDQPLEWIDLENLTARQNQNRLPDRLTTLWLDHVLLQEKG